MSIMTIAALAIVAPSAPPSETDWPALVQKPYEQRNHPKSDLPPLLIDSQKQPITTRAAWEQERSRLLARWNERLGSAPAKPQELDVRVERTEKQDGYTRTLLSFAAEGDDRIRAYLLVPDNLESRDRRPAVVVFHETTHDTLRQPVGLGTKPERSYAVHLTKRGYITLSPECYILKEPVGWVKGQAQALAKRRPGWTGLGKMTFDASRCIDFLETQAQVDRKRIGCIGFSLGAKEVLYAMAFEPRYAVGVANEGGVGLRMSNWSDAWYLTEKIKPFIPQFENHQILALAAPRPVLVLGGGSADGDASWPFVAAARSVYALYGAADRIGLFDHKGQHTFPPHGRAIAYRWLDHHLQHTPTDDAAGTR